MMKILCVHGWGFGPSMWQALNRQIADRFRGQSVEFTCADLGFYGSPVLPSGTFEIVIGHSLGVMWILENNKIRFDRLISINGFTCFATNENFSIGWSPRVLQRMRSGLTKNTNYVLERFFENCKASGFPAVHGLNDKNIETERLDWGLEALIRGDVREQWESCDMPHCVIAATNDQIVTPKHTETCFAESNIHWIESDSHCLPLEHPEKCAALVRELVETN